ncbi:MAG: cold shock domain-containing protein [Bacteroidota bacterium]
MARSKETYNKRDREKKRQKKKQDKLAKREERKEQGKTSLDDMIVYIDENGNFTNTPPDPTKKKKIKAENIEIGVPKREDEEPVIRTGRIEFFNDEKGFGFIKDLDTHEKFFVHVKGLLEEVREGDKVTFDLAQGLKGLNAVEVKKVD